MRAKMTPYFNPYFPTLEIRKQLNGCYLTTERALSDSSFNIRISQRSERWIGISNSCRGELVYLSMKSNIQSGNIMFLLFLSRE